jgi:fatty-acyl-CoA synthase
MASSIAWITDAVAGQVPSVSPDHPALAIGSDPPLTYGQLRSRELLFARALQAARVGKGDRVAILLRNSTDYVAWYLAIGRLGAISVRLNWRLSAPELAFQLQDSSPRLMVLDADFTGAVASIRAALPVQTYVVPGEVVPEWAVALDTFVERQGSEAFPRVSLEDPLTLMYTSGTTGRPKGAMLSHGNALWIGAIQSMNWRFDSTTVAVDMGPLFHAGGFEVLLLPTLISHGLAVTFPSGGFSLEGLLSAARQHQATAMLVYSFLLYEFDAVDDLAEQVPASLRRIVTGGDTIMPWAYDVFERRLPQVNLTQSYSLTEGGAVAVHLDHSVARGRESSVGRPQPMTEVKVVGGSGEAVAPGEVGEVWLRSPGVSIGYWNRPAESAETFFDGWCRTGDLGRVDAEGFLTLAGRAKDMIRSGGENIFPAELEKLLAAHSDVRDVAVVGVPDEKYVEVGCAVVVREPGSDVDEGAVRDFLAAQVAKFKVPKHYVFVDELPRNASGKVLKYALRGNYAHLGSTPTQPSAPSTSGVTAR